MASPSEIVERWDRKKMTAAANDQPPSGYILVDGKEVAVWLAPGQSTEDLPTFRKFRKVA